MKTYKYLKIDKLCAFVPIYKAHIIKRHTQSVSVWAPKVAHIVGARLVEAAEHLHEVGAKYPHEVGAKHLK